MCVIRLPSRRGEIKNSVRAHAVCSERANQRIKPSVVVTQKPSCINTRPIAADPGDVGHAERDPAIAADATLYRQQRGAQQAGGAAQPLQQAEIDLQGFTPFSQGYSGLTGLVLWIIAHKRHVPGAICDASDGPMFDSVLFSNIVGPVGATRPLGDTEDTLLER